MSQLLLLFVILRFSQHAIEIWLSSLNRIYYLNKDNQKRAIDRLGITQEEIDKAIEYAGDKYLFGRISGIISLTVLMAVLVTGGLGFIENIAVGLFGDSQPILTGLIFFGIIGVLMFFFSLPFSLYNTFVIEEKHGFNRQTMRGFFIDQLKGLLVMIVMGAPILGLILWIMEVSGNLWWVWAWLAMSGYSVLTAWLYPTFLAPLFNKFTPLDEGELRDKITALAKQVNFDTSGLYVMDASIRSSHGNAYFTGLFGKKRIVLFDTLVESLSVKEVVAVLAHELGHFKLHHVRWMLVRNVAMTGMTFFLLSLFIDLQDFYTAFKLAGISNYGALVVFSLWFGLLDFVLSPLETYLSRRNEFAADSFALTHVQDRDALGHALLKLRKKSQGMPISHPLYSGWYHSHPPMLERLQAMRFGASQ